MSALYWNPTYYGVDDVAVGPGALTSSSSTEPFAARVYFPTDYSTLPISIRPGTYRLIVFTHGDRSAPRTDTLCPPDRALDYQRWEAVLHMLAQCGFVVASPDVSDVSHSSEQTADRIEATVAWMRRGWRHASSLQLPAVFEASAWMAGPPPPGPTDPLADDPRVASERSPEPNERRGRFHGDVALIGVPTATALIGHSYGAKAGCIVIGRGNVQIRAFASIAGTFDDNNVGLLVASGIPTLLMAGSEDHETLSYLVGLWNNLSAPKHQAVLQGIGHWDWFGPVGGIQPCSPDAERPTCPIAWQTASELLLGFMTRHLEGFPFPPHLIGAPGQGPRSFRGTTRPVGARSWSAGRIPPAAAMDLTASRVSRCSETGRPNSRGHRCARRHARFRPDPQLESGGSSPDGADWRVMTRCLEVHDHASMLLRRNVRRSVT